jgi:hypothetical protein
MLGVVFGENLEPISLPQFGIVGGVVRFHQERRPFEGANIEPVLVPGIAIHRAYHPRDATVSEPFDGLVEHIGNCLVIAMRLKEPEYTDGLTLNKVANDSCANSCDRPAVAPGKKNELVGIGSADLALQFFWRGRQIVRVVCINRGR